MKILISWKSSCTQFWNTWTMVTIRKILLIQRVIIQLILYFLNGQKANKFNFWNFDFFANKDELSIESVTLYNSCTGWVRTKFKLFNLQYYMTWMYLFSPVWKKWITGLPTSYNPTRLTWPCFLAPCKNCTLLYIRTLKKSLFTSYQKHTTIYNWSPCKTRKFTSGESNILATSLRPTRSAGFSHTLVLVVGL